MYHRMSIASNLHENWMCLVSGLVLRPQLKVRKQWPPPRPRLFLDQTEAWRAEKFFSDCPPPTTPLYQGLDAMSSCVPVLVHMHVALNNR